MRKAIKQIGACAAILVVFCVVCRLVFYRTYTAYIPLTKPAEAQLQEAPPRIEAAFPEVAEPGKAEVRQGYLKLPVTPKGKGEVRIEVKDAQGETVASYWLRVSPFRSVYDLQSGGFTGDTAVMIAFTLFWLAVSAIMIWHYRQAKGPAYYAYSTIYYVGFALFALVTGILMMEVTIGHLVNPFEYNMMNAYRTINGASTRFMTVTMPLAFAFALAVIVSNIVLLLHERLRIQSMVGLLVGLAMIAGQAIGWALVMQDVSGSETEVRIRDTLVNVYATFFVYFECMLVGSVTCGISASRRRPEMDRDFIIILGCWFRKDGSLPPLLRGRVDRAVDFWRKQREETGREAILIPSGGQGKDEPMPEAAAMKQYLLAQQIPEDRIVPECESENTFQNMRNSRAILESINPGGKTLFATTSYHVFRSGIWAAQAGLTAEGIGSKTRWWFWPNAFMRECGGLMLKRWKQEILLAVILAVYFSLLSMILG